MYEKLEECPSCKHTKFSNYKICQDHSVSGESFALVLCERCQLVFTNPRPDQENILKYYDSKHYISHTNKSTNLINFAYKQVRKITLKQKLNLIRKYTKGNYALDFGCGTGIFMSYLTKKGFRAEGYEPDEGARRIAADHTNQEIFSNLKQIKKGDKYDIITAWHVLEHVHDLKDTVKLLRKRLKPNGFLFIAVPNINSHDAKLYDTYWAAYDVPRHLYHFSKESFSRLAQKCKLHIHSIEPMKFDAYYVSLLSEKYKHNKAAYLSAIKTAYYSNKLAETSGEYSSLIYVLTK